MKKRSGFTLIELLAVIVILAIILLISVPIILNVIEDARAGAFKNSAGYLVKAAENKYLRNQINGTEEDLVYEYVNGVVKDGKDLDYKGETPKNGAIVVRKDGKISIAIDNGKWCAIKDYNEDNINLIELKDDNCKLSDIPEIPKEPFDEAKGVNKPVLTAGMNAIKWNGVTEEVTTEDDPEWYDYANKKWANAAIWANNSRNDAFKTGCAGNAVSSPVYIGCQNAYNTVNGQKASTTHNITGIYDMSGGAAEVVSAYLISGISVINGNNGQNLVNAEEKYKDIYVSGVSDDPHIHYIANKNKYGDAIYETSVNGSNGNNSWEKQGSGMMYNNQPAFFRGGLMTQFDRSGVFNFSQATLSDHHLYTFRPVVIAQ